MHRPIIAMVKDWSTSPANWNHSPSAEFPEGNRSSPLELFSIPTEPAIFHSCEKPSKSPKLLESVSSILTAMPCQRKSSRFHIFRFLKHPYHVLAPPGSVAIILVLVVHRPIGRLLKNPHHILKPTFDRKHHRRLPLHIPNLSISPVLEQTSQPPPTARSSRRPLAACRKLLSPSSS